MTKTCSAVQLVEGEVGIGDEVQVHEDEDVELKVALVEGEVGIGDEFQSATEPTVPGKLQVRLLKY